MHNSESSILFGNHKNRTVELTPSWLNDSEFEPFSDVFLHFFTMSIRYFELFDVDRFFGPQSNFMHEVFCTSQVILILTEDIVMSEK